MLEALCRALSSRVQLRIAASTAAFAFAPQIARAVKDTAAIGKVALAKRRFRILGTMLGAARGGNLAASPADAAKAKNTPQDSRTNESVSNLRSRSESLQSTLNKYNSSSATAEKIAGKLVDVKRTS